MDKIINAEAFETFAVEVLKFTAEEVASLYNDAGELTDFTLVKQKDAQRIAKMASDKTNQYNRGLKEGAEKLEKAIKEKYEIDSDLIGVDLFDHVLEARIADVKQSSGEDIMKNPEVIKLMNQHTKALKDKDKELTLKLAQKEAEINKANLFQKVKDRALVEFEKLKPILPENPAKAQALKDVLLREIEKYNYQIEGDDFVVLKEDGTPLQNEHAYGVSFSEHIKGHADKYFEFKVADDRSSSGNSNSNDAGSKKVRVPKDKEDYVKIMQDQSLTPQERVEVKNLAVKAGFA